MTFRSQNNKIIIITAPSGAGKTSITHFLLEHISQACIFHFRHHTAEALVMKKMARIIILSAKRIQAKNHITMNL